MAGSEYDQTLVELFAKYNSPALMIVAAVSKPIHELSHPYIEIARLIRSSNIKAYNFLKDCTRQNLDVIATHLFNDPVGLFVLL